MNYEKSCGTIIIEQDKVLIIGSRDEAGTLYWSFPKGHQENNETDIETALRETREEVGLEVEIVDQVPFVASYFLNEGATRKEVFLFLAKIKSGTVKLQEDEVEVWQWTPLAEAGNLISDRYTKLWRKVIMERINQMDKTTFDKTNIFGLGNANDAFAEYFSGKSFLNPLAEASEAKLKIHNVTFEPGCRNNWHIHHAKSGGGQILLCIAGSGWYQEEGKEAQSLEPGSVVTIPANVKHWHGAKKDSWFSHVAIEVPGEETSNEWCEPVSDEECEN